MVDEPAGAISAYAGADGRSQWAFVAEAMVADIGDNAGRQITVATNTVTSSTGAWS